ncbi:layilin [Rhinatrema bivittatum]|uniref:layilin n=1 Tax=Rhinatrema bivittatum TaxID=194408 RepID=UPI00112C6A49|nr:layilin [Rhinatrema bivittatum]
MDPRKALAAALLLVSSLCRGSRLSSGQTICRGGTQRPCYKIVYFHDASRRVNFEEAQETCRRDKGHLVSIESEAEQKLIEKFILSLSASDGDFWLGLRRTEEDQENTTDCQSLYTWVDGSKPRFWNWYVDEPSCGSEVCVVMYHQPSAAAGMGGPYMFQWNDDRCNMRNNFICKYSLERPAATPAKNTSRIEVVTMPLRPKDPEEPIKEGGNVTVEEVKESIGNIYYILVPAVPLLVLVMITAGMLCFWLVMRRRQARTEVRAKEHTLWMPPHTRNSPSLEIYNVIKKQTDEDLGGARSDTKNTSFRLAHGASSPPDNLSGEYDNMAGAHSESGFVTLASTESGFVTNELYELCSDRVGRSTESAWVDNEIYGY